MDGEGQRQGAITVEWDWLPVPEEPAAGPGDHEAWSFQRIEDLESLLALPEDYRRHGTLNPDAIHSVDRLIAKLTVAARS